VTATYCNNLQLFKVVTPYYNTGWWFGTCFPYIGNGIIPTDEVIFFRGVGSTTNQNISIGIITTIMLYNPIIDDYPILIPLYMFTIKFTIVFKVVAPYD
jgi:hypothetical protein